LQVQDRDLELRVKHPLDNIAQKKLDFKANVVNEKAKQFFLNHKIEEIENGLEKQGERNSKSKDIVLMRTKNCIRYTLGQCLIRDKQTQDFNQELFLKDNKRTYKLHFDCKNCFMDLISLE
jgi:putative protease